MSSESALWSAVVSQAISDATANVSSVGPSGYKTAVLLRDQARRWLLSGSKDFRLVCEFAGLEPDAVRERVRVLEQRGWPQQISRFAVGASA